MPLYNPIDSTAIIDGSVSAVDLAPALLTSGYLTSGQYYYTVAGAPSTNNVLGNQNLRLFPWWVSNAVTLSRIGAEITVIGDVASKLRLGIYADNGFCYPGSLLVDAGQIAADSATVQEITISQAITPGLYWIGGAVQAAASTQPTVRTIPTGASILGSVSAGTSIPGTAGAASGFSQTSVSGALPASFTASVATVDRGPRVFVKVA